MHVVQEATLGNNPKLLRPVSKKARKLLFSMVEWSKKSYSKIFNSQAKFLEKFADIYDPIIYDEACHRFKDLSKYTSFLPSSQTLKTQENVLNEMTLYRLSNYSWTQQQGLDNLSNRSILLSNLKLKELYYWLTDGFILNDFHEAELDKISSMGEFDLDLIKREASNITDPLKHTISYLYAIVADQADKLEVVQGRQKVVNNQYKNKLDRLYKESIEHNQLSPFKGDIDSVDRWNRAQDYIDILESLKDD